MGAGRKYAHGPETLHAGARLQRVAEEVDKLVARVQEAVVENRRRDVSRVVDPARRRGAGPYAHTTRARRGHRN
jgi:hypothetical protein